MKFLPALVGLVCLAAGGAAADPLNPVGYPKKGDPGGGIGAIRVWFDDGKWHVRTSTEDSQGKRDKLMKFTGTVKCDGQVTAEGAKLEKGGQTSDVLKPHADGKGFDFEFKTYGGRDQVDFTVPDKAKKLTFKLLIDGEKAATSRIIVGANGDHPEKADFVLPANPKR